jgi:hypothetical protein
LKPKYGAAYRVCGRCARTAPIVKGGAQDIGKKDLDQRFQQWRRHHKKHKLSLAWERAIMIKDVLSRERDIAGIMECWFDQRRPVLVLE